MRDIASGYLEVEILLETPRREVFLRPPNLYNGK
jgi:hypothetical protein